MVDNRISKRNHIRSAAIPIFMVKRFMQKKKKNMKIAVVGCAHGELEKIYDKIGDNEEKDGFKVDLLLCCGDFQSTRNLKDLKCMTRPEKYENICTFYKYYSGEKVAPILTIFIGGNHEASNYLQELPYGGWVAPNIYYLGYAGVVTYKGIRIGGWSGIYKGYSYRRGHFELLPYDEQTKRSVYHHRQQELFRLCQVTGTVDVMMSHEWPTQVYNFGNASELISVKPHLRSQIYNNILGSPPCYKLLKTLKPIYWFAAHMHCEFTAIIPHEECDQSTKFFALDKCDDLARKYLKIFEIDAKDDSDNDLHYDLEWLTILHSTKHLTYVHPQPKHMPSAQNTSERVDFRPTADELAAMRTRMAGNLTIPKNFKRTAPAYDPSAQQSDFHNNIAAVKPIQNSQTVTFCNLLDIDDPLNLVLLMCNRKFGQYE